MSGERATRTRNRLQLLAAKPTQAMAWATRALGSYTLLAAGRLCLARCMNCELDAPRVRVVQRYRGLLMWQRLAAADAWRRLHTSCILCVSQSHAGGLQPRRRCAVYQAIFVTVVFYRIYTVVGYLARYSICAVYL